MPRPLAALFVFALLVSAGCGLFPGLGGTPDGDSPLVIVDMTGGLCPEGPCSVRTVLRRDGTIIRSDAPAGRAQTLDPAFLASITQEIDGADWAAILARPYTGSCARDTDGAAPTYTFPRPAGDIVVDSCVVDTDGNPFQSIEGALFGVGG